MADLNHIAEKWKKKWEESKTFEANPDNRKKFFINFPYPYINSYLHLGHAFSVTRVDVMARYKRMQGFNVLFPQGWHCTGTPVWAAAQRVAEKEPKQLKILESLGFQGIELEKFSEVRHWIDVFVPAAKEDLMKLGASVDWRRSFVTTDLNPRYDKFIRWQFRKLKEKGYVAKGSHPVVWCPKDKMPIGDHDRVEGEGEVPQEFSLIKHRLDDERFVVTATLREDTILGITNLYIHPDKEYFEVECKNEKWIIGEAIIQSLEKQGYAIRKIVQIKGIDLVGKYATVIGDRKVLILPAKFIDASFGTGIVHSVPSDSADDLISLYDLQKDEGQIRKYHLNADEIKAIKPIPVLNTPEYGDCPAEKFLKDFNVKSQHERDKLDKIKKELYKVGFYNSTFNELYRDFFEKNLYGMKVKDGKDYIRKELIARGDSYPYYQLSGKVVCRCLNECEVKLVSDQWFLKYGNEEWKDLTREALGSMSLYPEISRTQFNYVIGWLNDWACTHHHGTGTKLPWEEQWVIESLSDSTIYMAYYTISHLLNGIEENEIDDALFDYVLLGIGEGKKEWKKMRESFEYWYPFDVRSSGKDLIQNHLAFCLFNHTAIFPKKYWPKSFSVNGWLLVDGEKMSKSKGNFFTIREIVEKYSADVARASLMLGGEGMSDPNFDMNNANAIGEKLSQWIDFAKENHKKTHHSKQELSTNDRIFISGMNRSIKEGTAAMESMLFRSAFERLFFQMQKALKDYIKRKGSNQELMNDFIEIQTKLISPFCPFAAEEAWHSIGRKNFVSEEEWPRFDESKIDEKAEAISELIESTRRDIYEIMRLAKANEPSKITLFVSEKWKYDFFSKVKEACAETRSIGEISKKIMKTELRKHGEEISKILPKLVNDPGKMPQIITSQEEEKAGLNESLNAIAEEFKCKIEIVVSEKSNHQKAKQAMPGKIAIVVE